MRKKRFVRYAFFVYCGAGMLTLAAQDNVRSGDTGKKEGGIEIFTQNGPDSKQSINVVPIELRHGFHLFQAKCAQCHSLDRTLQKSNLSVDEWGDVVYRMQDMASSHMTPSQSAAIAKYLVWNDGFQQKAGRP